MSDAESSLLLPVDRVDKVTCMDLRNGSFTEELKRLIYFAAPLAAVDLWSSLSSHRIVMCLRYGQAYGAKLYRKLGVQTYTAMFCLTLVCIPIAIIWLNIEKLLVFLSQDHAIAHEAGRYAAWLIPGLFSYASMITPLLITSTLVFCFHAPLCWLLVYKSGLGFLGGAVAMGLSSWLCAIILGCIMCFSSACSETRAPLSMEIFNGVGEFFRYALPSAAMVCLEWWSFELIILLSGLLPNPELETSVLSICLQTIATVSAIPIAIAAAASTRIFNELGAGNSRAAHIVVYTATFLAVMESLVVSMSLLVGRSVFGYVFSSDERTVDYVAKMAPLLSISIILDGLQAVLAAGIARGCGWQHIGAYINLGSFYLCGIPFAATLAFWFNLEGVGLWIGIQAGALVQNFLLGLFTGFTNWQNLVHLFPFFLLMCPYSS
ncbi:unnamed protein product [Brassica oleracea var. botrytis]